MCQPAFLDLVCLVSHQLFGYLSVAIFQLDLVHPLSITNSSRVGLIVALYDFAVVICCDTCMIPL